MQARLGSLVLIVWRSDNVWCWSVWRHESTEVASGHTQSRWRAMNLAEAVARTIAAQTGRRWLWK